MQAEEARVAVRAAEIATQVALDAQATAEDALAELHAAATEPNPRGPSVVESIARARAEVDLEPQAPQGHAAVCADAEYETASVSKPVAHPDSPSRQRSPSPASTSRESQPFAIRWDPDVPVRVLQHKPAPAQDFQLSAEDWWTPAQVTATLRNEPIRVEPQQSHANLIEFPREIVATRRMRPRLAEAPLASLGGAETQLSIFEVDPGTVSTEPAVASAPEPASAWSGPEWSGIELDENPRSEAEVIPAAQRVFLAPIGLRFMASVVDSSLILAAFFAAAMLLVSRLQSPPAGKPAEILAAAGLVLAGFLYHALFFALGISTPGMRYAGIALSTFDDLSPTRAQLRRRLGSMALSLAPVGLGFAWSIFDDDHLTWHDRISQTYLRKCYK